MAMLYKLKIAIFLIVTFILFSLLASRFWVFVKAEIDCQNANPSGFSAGDAEYCSQQLQNIINAYLPAQTANKKNLLALQSQLNDINKRISALSSQIEVLTKNITEREEELAYAREILNQKAVTQYKNSRLYNPILALISATDAAEAFRIIKLMGFVAEEDRKIIEKYANDLLQLKNDEDALQKSKDLLAVSQKQLAERTKFLAAEVAKVDTYLAGLSAKQQAFIAAKLESLGISRSAYNLHGGCSSDINPFKSPGFSPAYGFFTFGVPNRVGMNQYGAWGRAKAHQDYDQILRAYYNFDGYQDFSSITINVNNGNGINDGGVIWSGSLEDYVKRIYEVPDSWTDNDSAALKAQAIAARSYVLAATNNGANSICANEHCQVFKTDPKGGNWEGAVNATPGKVMVQGGSPIKAWFSAVHGGYAFNSGDIGWSLTSWTKRMVDTPSGSAGSFSDLLSNAYDRDAQWFYCDWGGRSAYSGTGWLKPDELADITNAVLLARLDGSTKSHLYQTDKSNPESTDTWDAARVKSELASRGGTPIDNATGVSIVADFGTGRTTSVTINGQTINGDEFKNYFNLRAPSNIQIVGPLYNVEIR